MIRVRMRLPPKQGTMMVGFECYQKLCFYKGVIVSFVKYEGVVVFCV